MKKRFITIFPFLEKVHLYKDVGSIPYYLAKDHGWETFLGIMPGDHGDLEELQNLAYFQQVKLLSLGLRSGKAANVIKVLFFLFRRGKDFDVCNLYHDTLTHLFYALVFKLGNSSGNVYIKLDMNHLDPRLQVPGRTAIIPRIKRWFQGLLSRWVVDMYSVETTELYQKLEQDQQYRGKLFYIPNGFNCEEGKINSDKNNIKECLKENNQESNSKENIIITVGNIGSYPKYNELLVDAIAKIDQVLIKGWRVYFVGPLVNEDYYTVGYTDSGTFEDYVKQVVSKCPHLRETFVLTGEISERKRLFELYRRSKIFCLTSRYESFGIALLEAMYFGNYVISSDLPASRDITDKGSVGALFESGDALQLSQIISRALSGKVDLETEMVKANKQVLANFNWTKITKHLSEVL